MLGVKKFYYLTWKKSEFSLTLNIFNHGPLPILWHNQGLYGLIPVEVVANAIQYLKTKKVSTPPYPVNAARVEFHWDQARAIPQQIGEQLFNEQFNNQTDSSEG